MSFNTLTWGVKESFRNYVEGAGGTINVSDGASRTDDGAIVFTALPGGNLAIAADGSAAGAMRFQGTVVFEAHGGMLKSTVTELALETGSEGLVLTSLDTPINKDRCTIATLKPVENGERVGIVLSARITVDGMYQIADNYPPGTELDPLRLA